MPILYAIILAIMIFPVQNFLEKKWKCNRLIASLCSITIIFSVISLLVAFFLSRKAIRLHQQSSPFDPTRQ